MRVKEPLTRFEIITVDDGWNGHVTAHYNPKELQVDKTTKWSANPGLNGNVAAYTFDGSDGRTVSLELFFDAYERGATVHEELATLHRMMEVVDPASPDEKQRRPPTLRIANGVLQGFVCVLESLSVKVVMFDSQYRAARAVVNIKLKEVSVAELHGRGSQQVYAKEEERRAKDRRAKDRAARDSGRGA